MWSVDGKGDQEISGCFFPSSNNYLQRMSGIAAYTHSVAGAFEEARQSFWIRGKRRRICGFLKSMPLRVGGGYNHRYNLSDGVCFEDITSLGSRRCEGSEVRMAKNTPFVRKIEVEVEERYGESGGKQALTLSCWII